MPKKYDTNPLNPDFPQKAKEAQTETLPNLNAETQRFSSAAPTEEQTRKFNDANFSNYSAPYNGQNVPQNYKAAPFQSNAENSSTRKVSGVGLPENIMVALPYVPFQIGLIASIVELLIVPRSETKVRFHAAQGLAVNLAILIIASMLSFVGHLTSMADAGNKIFYGITLIMLFVWTLKAWKGKPVHIEAVDDLTNWLDEKIKPKN